MLEKPLSRTVPFWCDCCSRWAWLMSHQFFNGTFNWESISLAHISLASVVNAVGVRQTCVCFREWHKVLTLILFSSITTYKDIWHNIVPHLCWSWQTNTPERDGLSKNLICTYENSINLFSLKLFVSSHAHLVSTHINYCFAKFPTL